MKTIFLIGSERGIMMSIELNNQQIYALYDIENWWEKEKNQVYEISGAAGTGKAQPISTMIPTPTGPKKLGDLKVGEYIFDKNGKETKILGIYDQGKRDVYRITFEDGRETFASKEHLWNYYTKDGDIDTKTTEELIDKLKAYKYIDIPICSAVEYPTKKYKIDPYLVGVCTGVPYDMKIQEEYLYGDSSQRRSLIQGLFDVRGQIKDGKLTYITRNFELAADIREILFSLGYKASITIYLNHGNDPCYTLHVECKNSEKHKFFKLERKKLTALSLCTAPDTVDNTKIAIQAIVKMGYQEEMRCLYVDNPEHLYLTNDFIVTHNTTLVKYFIERIGLDKNEAAYVAFSGKAAMQLARSGLPARTIHSLIYDHEKVKDLDEDGHVQYDSRGNVKLKWQFTLKRRLPKEIQLIVVDEASMVNADVAKDLLSFGIPVIALGDLNQLPPVIGSPFFLRNPNFILTEIMRQAENDPIVWLANRVLNDEPLDYGVYGKSCVIKKSELNDYFLKSADVVLTGTNKLRARINDLFRETLYNIRNLDTPQIGEKIICRKNNWNRSIQDYIYLTNGLYGFIDYVDIESFNGKDLKIDFRPDFLNKKFKNLVIDYKRLFAPLGQDSENSTFARHEQFEFAYALTVHLMQGSQAGKVVYLDERSGWDKDTYKRLQYTAITRAQESIIIVR